MSPLGYVGAGIAVGLLAVATVVGAAVCAFEAGNRAICGCRDA